VADKPGHIIEIPDSLGRDVDKAKAGKLKGDLPIEAFLSDAALTQAEQQTSKAAVHAEDLTPISGVEAAARRTQHGASLPSMPATRRVIPEPFRRPSVSLDRHGRSWQRCRAEQVQEGDVVPGAGRVESVELVTRYETIAGVPDVAVGMKVIIKGAGGAELPFNPKDMIQAFRPAGDA
jgi:hypothetical protein